MGCGNCKEWVCFYALFFISNTIASETRRHQADFAMFRPRQRMHRGWLIPMQAVYFVDQRRHSTRSTTYSLLRLTYYRIPDSYHHCFCESRTRPHFRTLPYFSERAKSCSDYKIFDLILIV